MGEISATVLAAEEGGETSNFLLPNGTFFFVLLIFLIVLGVIGEWVVPPVSKVLRERDAMLTKTTADNRRAAEQLAAAQADYDEAMARARAEASAIRDEARAEGRQILDEMRGRASGEVAATLQKAPRNYPEQGRANRGRTAVIGGSLSATLASRMLGVDVDGGAGGIGAESVAACRHSSDS